MKAKQFFCGLLLVFLSLTMPVRADFLGKAATGIQELKDYRYPVSLYVPESYNPSRTYPFLIAVPDSNENPAKYIEEWQSVARKKNMIVLVPSLQMRDEDVPYTTDKWLFAIKSDIQKQYKIDGKKIFLVGKNLGAHYAGYLGVKYPQEFSAVALLDRSWAGPFEKLMQFRKSPADQRPFYAAVSKTDEAGYKEAERVAFEMTRSGYPVYLEKADKDAFATSEFKKKVVDWLEEKSASWSQAAAESGKSFKAKTRQAVKEFFEVK